MTGLPLPNPKHGFISGSRGLRPGTRYVKLRSSGRKRIPHEMRVAVYKRDGKRCRFCGRTENLHLDHVIPWSAGGLDNSSNLRILCAQCNDERSNRYTYEDERRQLPVASACVTCVPQLVTICDEFAWRILVFCKQCEQDDYSYWPIIDLGLLP